MTYRGERLKYKCVCVRACVRYGRILVNTPPSGCSRLFSDSRAEHANITIMQATSPVRNSVFTDRLTT